MECVAKAIAREAGAQWPQDANRYRSLARAAVKAMREPSETMTRALYDAGANNFAWQSAIDAALDPAPDDA